MFVPAALAPALLPISLSGKSSSPLANANYRKLMRMHSVVIVHEAHLRQIAPEGIVLMRSASQVERNGGFLGSANDAVSREQFGQGCTNLTFWTFFPFFCSLIAKNRKDTSSPFFFLSLLLVIAMHTRRWRIASSSTLCFRFSFSFLFSGN
jgi:hypothetical protein